MDVGGFGGEGVRKTADQPCLDGGFFLAGIGWQDRGKQTWWLKGWCSCCRERDF